jgi:signal peptidase
MVPEFDINSLILVKEVPEEKLDVGDIITFYPAQDNVTVLTHRITRIESEDGQPVYYTQGDANNVEDPNPVKYASIIGVTVFWIDKVGGFLLNLRTPAGIAWIVGITLFLLILTHIIETMNKQRALKKKKKRKKKKIAARAATDPRQVPPRDPAARKRAPDGELIKKPKAASSARNGTVSTKDKVAKPKAATSAVKAKPKAAPAKAGKPVAKAQAKPGTKKKKVESA